MIKPLLVSALFAWTLSHGYKCGTDASYDYVIVGGGTAGSVVATRLAKAGFEVVILEAGGIYESILPELQVPGNMYLTWGTDLDDINLSVDWGFVTTPQAGANDRRIHYAQGKGLGGSYVLLLLGTQGSYHAWAEKVNDSSYEWEQILPFFKRGIRFTPPDPLKRPRNATAAYNPGAFLRTPSLMAVEVSYSNQVGAFLTWFKRSLQSAGIPEIQDFNSGRLLGTQYCSSTLTTKARRSSADSLIAVLAGTGKSTLTVCVQTMAKRIIFDESKSAVGVLAESKDAEFTVSAKKEIIIATGSFHSPQLLMVSGIGPAETLEKHDIAVLVDLPGVGQDMWDHPFFGLSYPVTMTTATRFIVDPQYQTDQTLKYMAYHKGYPSQVVDTLGWEKLPLLYRKKFPPAVLADLARFPADWPEAEYIGADYFVSNLSNATAQQPRDGHSYASILGALVSPTSRGNVTIVSKSTHDLPRINPNWLTTETDQHVALAMFKRIRSLWRSEPLHSIVIGPEAHPGEKVKTDKQILHAIRESVIPIWHPAGTCKMGMRGEDPTAVLDSRARVFGVNRLRVVDASAFPVLPPGHPQSTVYMLAEKISADIIKGESRDPDGDGDGDGDGQDFRRG
ncbi:putative GMC oxidoreductase [Aspergillus heteromorphus CBS 117.55]|uniref:Putative GMC oxidoreductase n=1 Tax=Aspergillus heteromorphus CBS 117.55 TaxID=1448321 RepID=A0A317VUY7_9EURO|nr:putative GMC oxidoreductase [Aspergillus heteromorphus CBS 117.55]PWY78196.1 putative GMC oxidoreductase [Aspergillus heteromorphus CBS 117.55]